MTIQDLKSIEFLKLSDKQLDLLEKYMDLTLKEKIKQDYETQESFIQMLASSQARIFDFQMHVMLTANSKEQLEFRRSQVRSYLEDL